MQDVQKAVEQVSKAGADPEVRQVRRMEIGHVVQQGDVYLHRVPDDHPRGKQIGAGSVQIALGTGNGARHMAEGAVKVYEGTQMPAAVRVPEDFDPAQLLGPVVVADESWMLTHPEHPHHACPAGTFQTTYQADLRTMRRVAD